MAAPSPLPRLRLRVSRSAELHLRAGHPWLYEGSVREQNREGEAGELAVVYDHRDRFLAIGMYDPHSPLRLRTLHVGMPANLDRAWWAARLDAALGRRAALFGPLSAEGETTGYRLVNGESDGLPGLVVDRYAGTLVLKVYTAAWFQNLPLLLDLLGERAPGMSAVLRLSRNIQALAEGYGLHDGQLLRGELNPLGPQGQRLGEGRVVFRESGLNFEADVLQGQKTGFFLDQRENRRRVEALSGGRRVMNAFAFTGGFSLYAARGGASEVLSVDISPHALAGAERNFALNPALKTPHETLQTDVFTYLPQAGREFDLIILDPPSLARREAEREGAVRAYAKLAGDAARWLSPGGVLVSASCSAHVSADEFESAVMGAVKRTGRRWRKLHSSRHAPDHHAAFKEAEYLKAVFVELS